MLLGHAECVATPSRDCQSTVLAVVAAGAEPEGAFSGENEVFAPQVCVA